MIIMIAMVSTMTSVSTSMMTMASTTSATTTTTLTAQTTTTTSPWGKGSDVIGTKLRFRKGDIIFGRRRAYQRKLAVAEMDGICSAHAMVVRAKPALVLPEFLPFLMIVLGDSVITPHRTILLLL